MENMVIKSRGGQYEVHFIKSISQIISRLDQLQKCAFVIDRIVYNLYPELSQFLNNKTYLLLDATEEEKTWAGVGRVLSWYQKNNITKANQIVAIGGGIIQDIVCFSCSVYYRGIKWQFVPTTILSMADSCIGAKCAVNFNSFKNQIGTFHSPKGVFICSEFANTLDEKDVKSGYGEILKLSITGSKEHFRLLAESIVDFGLRGSSLLELINKSLNIKKEVIEADEFEDDYRRILNYGHTLGHSLESITEHLVPHGLAVAWGIDLINFLSWKRGLIVEADYIEIHQFIKKHLSFKLSRKIEAQELINGAKRDKKAIGDSINLILLSGFGSLKITKVNFDEELMGQIDFYLKEFNVYA